MNFNTFLKNIPKIKEQQLKGLEIQLAMAPLERKQLDLSKIIAKKPKKAAVLILFYPNKKNETCFLLTERATYKGTHSAQISFPGGKICKTDKSLKDTALRESYEEVNVKTNEVAIFKSLTKTYIPPSNFWVYPFVAITEKAPVFKKNYEVNAVIEVKLTDLLDDANVSFKNLTTSYLKNAKVPCFILNNYVVWGATAMILNELKDLLLNTIKEKLTKY